MGILVTVTEKTKGNHCLLCKREFPVGEQIELSFGETFCLDKNACYERYKALSLVPTITLEIIPDRLYMYVGGKGGTAATSLNKIKYVVNVIADDKGRNKDKAEDFIRITESINRGVKARRRVLLRCHGVTSRAPALAALYLFYSRVYKDYDDALQYVCSKSQAFKPNPELVDFIKNEVIPKLRK